MQGQAEQLSKSRKKFLPTTYKHFPGALYRADHCSLYSISLCDILQSSPVESQICLELLLQWYTFHVDLLSRRALIQFACTTVWYTTLSHINYVTRNQTLYKVQSQICMSRIALTMVHNSMSLKVREVKEIKWEQIRPDLIRTTGNKGKVMR